MSVTVGWYTGRVVMRRRCVLLGFLASVAVSGAARAGEPPAAGRAIELFRKSEVEYKAGRFAEAAALLKEAYAIYPEPTLLYNLARALEGLGDLEGAVAAYDRYLGESREVADAAAIRRRLV